MAIVSEVVADKTLNISTGTPVAHTFPMFAAADLVVYYGVVAPAIAVQSVDYTFVLAVDFQSFTVTPTAALLAKIDALILNDPTNEINYMTVRRDMDNLTPTTPASVRQTQFASTEFDRTAMRLQQLQDNLNRALTLSPNFVGDTPKMELTEAKADTALVFNATGDGIVVGPTADEITSAQGYAVAALASKDAAGVSETNSAASEDKAQDWAEEVEDTPVEVGKFSALHHAAKAADSAATFDLTGGVQLTPRTAPAHSEAFFYYDSDVKSFVFFNDQSTSSLTVGRETWVRCVNKTGVTISDGDVVYISGSQGNKPTIALADRDTDVTSRLIGLVTHDIANNAEGEVTVAGIVRNLDTSAFTEGDTVYLSSTAGGYAAAVGGAGFYDVKVGVVLNAHLTQGQILVQTERMALATETIAGLLKIATQAKAVAGTDDVDAMTALKTKQAFNASGSAPMFACRAWCRFDGTAATITDSGNVSSLTDVAVGRWKINFATNMADANFMTTVSAAHGGAGTQWRISNIDSDVPPAVGDVSVNVVSGDATTDRTYIDNSNVNVSVFN